MVIKDVIALAKYSELAGVAAKNDIDAIVAFINLGMVEIYTRFPIKVEEALIALEDDKVYYTMPDNFMYPLKAFGEVPETADAMEVVQLSINDEEDPLSIFFNDWKTVQIPEATAGAHISIIYVANPIRITALQAEDEITSLAIPDSLIDCLLSYVGYRAHLGVKSDASSENNAHWKRFERSCKKAEELGVAFPSDSMTMPTRITDRGFV
tara:strand:+ start:5142 stop:5771 length:630 start_codon:yes stop_codon:yes gene_type:complete